MIAPLLVVSLLLSAEPLPPSPLAIVRSLGPRPMVVPGGIAALTFGPDGKTLLAAGSYGDLVKFQLATGQAEWRSDHGVGGAQHLALLLGRSSVGLVGDDGAPVLYDPVAGQLRHPEHQEACGELACVGRGVAVVLGDGRHAVSGLAAALVEFDLEDKDASNRIPLAEGDLRITALGAAPNAQRVLAGTADGTISCWDVEAAKLQWRASAHSAGVTAIAVTKDGKQAITASADGEVRQWNAATGSPLATFRVAPAAAEGEEPRSLVTVLSPDGRYALVGPRERDEKNPAAVWEVKSHKRLWAFSGPGEWTGGAAAFSSDGTQLAFAEVPGGMSWLAEPDTVRIVASATGKPLQSGGAHQSRVTALAVSADGQQVLSGAGDGELALWDLPSGKRKLTMRGHPGAVLDVALLADGARALSLGAEGTVRLWALKNGQQLGLWLPAPPQKDHRAQDTDEPGEDLASPLSPRPLALSTEGGLAAAPLAEGQCGGALFGEDPARCGLAYRLGLFDAFAGTRLRTVACSAGPIASPPLPRFVPGTKRLVIGCAPAGDKPASLETVLTSGQRDEVYPLEDVTRIRAISNAGLTVLVAVDRRDGSHPVLRLGTTEAPVLAFRGGDRELTAVAAMSEQSAVSTSFDGTIRLWDIAGEGEQARVDLTHPDADVPRSIAVLRGGKRLLVGTERGAILLLELTLPPAAAE